MAETKIKKMLRKLIPAFAVMALFAQDTKPACDRCQAAYIANDELMAYLKRAPGRVHNDVSDQQVRAVDVGKSNVAIGIVYRQKLTAVNPVAEHDFVSEVYHVIDGSATLVTGPDIEGWQRRPATNENVRMLNGPGGDGKSIRGGKTYELKPGDVIVIPAGVGHWFTKIDDHIRYLMVRIDPDKVTPLKDESASKADLAK
jgi:mannose-6-phosphate isomerase-like protein (cupin superfamily)